MAASGGTRSEILDWIAASQGDMLELLERLVNIDSGSYDKAGVDAVGDAIIHFLNAAGVETSKVTCTDHGDAIRAMVPAAGGNRPIMLMGHRDTVFPKGEVAKRPFRIEGGRAFGPGVADMKAGLVMNAFVLAAFAKFGGAPAPLLGLFTGDEEIGSPSSRPIIESTAREAAMVFNSEPGRPSGNVVTGRKGGIFFVCEIDGVAAHSGGQFEKGRSAIEELARKVQAWHALTDLDSGITLNVGLVAGGQSVNTVAPHARAEIDLRYVALGQRDAIVTEVERIGRDCTVDGTSSVISIKGEFNPLNATQGSQALFDHYVAGAADVGLNVQGEFSGGCADSGFTAAVGTPTVCATGPVGANAHSPDEFMEIATMVPRAQALAIAILGAGRLARV